MSASDPTLSQENIFDILSSGRRRYVIFVLRREDRPMEVTELAEEVAAWENETSVDDLSSQERKRVYVSLYQTHVPKLVEAGIVAYDEENGLVQLTDDATQIDRYLLEPEESTAIPWPSLYLPVLAVTALVAGLAVLDVSVFAGISDAVVGLVLFAGLAGTVCLHLLYRYVSEKPIPPELSRHE